MRIAIQGEVGSFSHQAALQMEPGATIVPCALSAEVFQLLENGEVNAAVIPIENSLAGSVLEHFDLLLRSAVHIERESLLRIRHNLIAVPGSVMPEISQVLSHPVALAQCRRFFAQHPAMAPTPFYDTAGSVKHVVARGDKAAAAIAGEQAARAYGGEILAAGIEDNPANYTRFLFIRAGARGPRQADADKISIAFTVENRPGTLVSALQVFAQHDTNLCKIESRPVEGQPWQYVFYADCQVTAGGENRELLDQLRRHCLSVKELGQYLGAKPLS
ncbi:MAG: prephenate dehydratase [Acidobacteriaceae bacterium]